MGLFDNLRSWLLEPLMDSSTRERIDIIETNRNYRRGNHPDTMKVKWGKADDNVTINLIGLAIARSVALLFGKGVEFDLEGDDESEQQDYIDTMWKLNRKAILLHKLAMNGAEAGTAYVKIMPDWYERDGRFYPRLVVVLPEHVTIQTDPEDMEIITGYTIQYITEDVDGKEMGRKQEITKEYTYEGDGDNMTVSSEYWMIDDYQLRTGGRWELIGSERWDYEFAPMLHVQNLPSSNMVYGEPDITGDVIKLNNRVNYTAANIGKIIRYHAHPKTLLFGTGAPQKVDDSADQLWTLSAGSDAKNLEMQSDLSSSEAYLAVLREMFMDVTRTVDVSSLPDKIGALTNFGLRVLYQDALQKLATKRELYGEMLTEINRRAMVLADMEVIDGEVVWPDPLPTNGAEESQAVQADLAMGIVSKQTISKARGYRWNEEQERIAGERAGEDDIGTRILENFMTGRQNER